MAQPQKKRKPEPGGSGSGHPNEESDGASAGEEGLEGLPELQAALSGVYGMPFPLDLFVAWEVACELCMEKPLDAFSDLGVQLVGPFELLAARSFKRGSNPHLHWRYFFDPPEFMTVMVGKTRHYGYFRDEPLAAPQLVASGTAVHFEFTVE
eukprot:RCo005642